MTTHSYVVFLRMIRGLWIGAVAAACFALPARAADPDWWDATAMKGWITDMPDFYQHQFAFADANAKPVAASAYTVDTPYPGVKTGTFTTDWEKNGGWCAGTAMLDTMYYWNNKADFNGLIRNQDITKPNKWVTPMGDNILYNMFLGGAGGPALPVNKWFNTLGFGLDSVLAGGKGLGYAEYLVVQAGADKGKVSLTTLRGAEFVQTKKIAGAGMRNATAFDVFKDQMLESRTVNLRLGTGSSTDPRLWWAGSYHLTAGAGLDATGVTDTDGSGKIYIADPDSNKGSIGTSAGVDNSQNDPAVPAAKKWYGTGNVPIVPAARKYPASGSEGPVPIAPRDGTNPKLLQAGFDQYYGFLKLDKDGFTVTDSDHAAVGDAPRYKGTTITGLGITSPIGARKVAAAPGPGGDTETTLRISNTILNPIDMVEIFPDQAVDPGAAGGNYLTSDPFGYSAPNGGELFQTSGLLLSPSNYTDLAVATLGTNAVSGFDEFYHDSSNDLWFAFSTASLDPNNDVVYGLQQAIPEPGTAALALVGIGIAALYGWRPRKQSCNSNAV